MNKFSFVDINQRRYTRDKEPNECPICHFTIKPDEIEWTLTSSRTRLEVVCKCTRLECKSFFIARYSRSDDDIPNTGLKGISRGLRQFLLQELVPSIPQKPHIPEEVANVSILFPEIYAQAIAAESYGLDQIAGAGYRKALEFLVKDFCISKNKEDESKIKASYLGTCIQKYVNDPQVKLCAERAAWLGNDEVHFVRRWTDKDIMNLKELVILTMNWIHSNLLTQKYADEMPKNG